MSIRIYALAKDLDIESKSLVDVCQKLGINVRGSALASLTDEEIQKVKDHLSQTKKTSSGSASGAAANNMPIPPTRPVTYGKVPDLSQRAKPRPRPEDASAAAQEPSVEPVSSPVPPEEAAPAPQPAPAPVSEVAPVSKTAPVETVSEAAPVAVSAPEIETLPADSKPEPAAQPEPPQPKEEPAAEPQPKAEEPKPEQPKAEEQKSEAEPVQSAPQNPPVVAVVEESEPKPSHSKTPVIHVVKRAEERKHEPEKTEKPAPAAVKPQLVKTNAPQGDKASSKTQPVQSKPEVKAQEPPQPAPQTQTPSPSEAAQTPAAPEKPQPVRKRSIPVINVIGHREERKKPDQNQRQNRDERVKRDGRLGPLGRLLAPMPEVKTPVQKKEKEPVAQKPDIKLSTEVIRNVKSGKAPLEKHLKQVEIQRQEEEAAAEADRKGKIKPKKANTPTETTAEDTVSKSKPKSAKRGGAPVLVDREQRQKDRKRKGITNSALPPGRKGSSNSEDSGDHTPRTKHLIRTGQNTAAPRKNKIVISLPITVRSFSEELGLPVGRVLGKLMQMGAQLVITSPVDAETAELLAAEFEIEVEIRQAQSLEEKLLVAAEELEDKPEDLKARPPVITFLGHVDHGKTSLLDRIIGINVCSGEKGGITQHIRAYQISKNGNKITFVDTPGHQAFTEMRARGANCTDIAVLVVAADDGVMPQTEEAISHARAAGVPIVVALNKVDIPGVNIPKVMQELASHEVLPSEWGGDVEVVKCSAMTGEGIDDLLDTLLTVAELREYKANPKRQALGICLESQLNQDQGAVAKVLVQNGTLKVGDIVVCGSAYGRVKSMTETLQTNKKVQKALPSMPVNLYGLDKAPGAGDKFYVLDGISDAREIAARKAEEEHQKDLLGAATTHVTLENLFDTMDQHSQTLNIILRTDVRGSIEAIRAEIAKLENPEVQIRVLQAMVGGITEADVALADASNAIIFGFNVVPDENARVLAEQKGVQVRRYDIIYKMTDDLKAAMEGMLKPEEKETDLGRIVVQKKFVISHVGTIAGCRVLSGSVQRNSRVRLIRDNRVIGDYAIDTLKHEKDDVKEALQGHECGIKLQGFNDIKEGDVFEAYKIEEVTRKL